MVSERSVDETKLMLACDDGTVVNTLSLSSITTIPLAAVELAAVQYIALAAVRLALAAVQ